jgi:V8-like Glu-specific endopeptidase
MRKTTTRWVQYIMAAVTTAPLAIAGCSGTVDSGPAQVAAPEDPVLTALSASGRWERANTPVKLAHGARNDAFHETATDAATREQAARQDRSWYAADGERYDALFVLDDGTTYGRRGPAPTAVVPDATNKFGAFEGAKTHPVDDTLEGSVWTDPSVDHRARYSSGLTAYPLRTAGNMSYDGTTGGGACSGTKVGPRDVLTASHCVFDVNGNWTTSGTFNPGQTNTTTPNGTYSWHGVYARDWRVDDHSYDYAVVFVDDSQAFVNLGWMGVEWWNSASSYTGMTAKNRGYPCGPDYACGAITTQECAASPRSDKRCDGWMYGMDSTLTSTAYRTDYPLLNYNNDVSEGHSGSAIFNTDNAVIAIVTHQEGSDHSAPCQGPRFRQSMWNDVCSWIADPNYQSAYGQNSLCHP